MISFIIIGRNEGWKLTQCLQSVYQAIGFNNLIECEVIYVDSKSSDDSIERAKKFETIKIFQLTGEYNAAIARNIGVKESKGGLLCFLDGDLELHKEFLTNIKNFDFSKFVLSGTSINYYYNYNWEFLYKENRNKKKSILAPLTCGYFFISKSLWGKADGMKPYLKSGEDPDMGLRLSKLGYLMLRKNEFMVNHHTIYYKDNNRMWIDLFNKKSLYATSVLIRENIYNKYTLMRLYESQKSLIILILSIVISIIIHPLLFFIFPLAILIRSKKNSKTWKQFVNYSINQTTKDIINLLGFFFFWPKKNISVNYIRIR